MLEPRDQGTIESFDGTRIGWQVFGEGPPIVLANGVGVTWRGMSRQVDHLRERHRVICWDYRGIFSSGPAGIAGVCVEAHARDALAVMDALGVRSAGLLGWSMGVQVAFDLQRLAPDRVTGIACIGGVPYDPFRAAFPVPVLHRLARRGIRASAHIAPLATPFLRRALSNPAFFRAAVLARYVREEADRDAFLGMARDVGDQDHANYLRTLAELGRHDLRDGLPHVGVPVLFLVGAKDLMIRPGRVRKVARSMRDGRVHVVEGCSHFVTVEAPEEVNTSLEGFFDELDRRPDRSP